MDDKITCTLLLQKLKPAFLALLLLFFVTSCKKALKEKEPLDSWQVFSKDFTKATPPTQVQMLQDAQRLKSFSALYAKAEPATQRELFHYFFRALPHQANFIEGQIELDSLKANVQRKVPSNLNYLHLQEIKTPQKRQAWAFWVDKTQGILDSVSRQLPQQRNAMANKLGFTNYGELLARYHDLNLAELRGWLQAQQDALQPIFHDFYQKEKELLTRQHNWAQTNLVPPYWLQDIYGIKWSRKPVALVEQEAVQRRMLESLSHIQVLEQLQMHLNTKFSFPKIDVKKKVDVLQDSLLQPNKPLFWIEDEGQLWINMEQASPKRLNVLAEALLTLHQHNAKAEERNPFLKESFHCKSLKAWKEVYFPTGQIYSSQDTSSFVFKTDSLTTEFTEKQRFFKLYFLLHLAEWELELYAQPQTPTAQRLILADILKQGLKLKPLTENEPYGSFWASHPALFSPTGAVGALLAEVEALQLAQKTPPYQNFQRFYYYGKHLPYGTLKEELGFERLPNLETLFLEN